MKKKNTLRADGRMVTSVSLGYDADGKRIRRYVYGRTQSELDRKVAELKIKVGKGLDTAAASRDVFRTWAQRWLDIQEGKGVSAAYLTCCRSYIEHLNESLGDIVISKITVSDVQGIINHLASCNPNTGKPPSRKFLVGLRAAARGVFSYALQSRVLEYDPSQFVTIPKTATDKGGHRMITDAEIEWIEDTQHRAQPAALMMLYCGLRRGEILALKWSDIDTENKTIAISKTVARTGGNTFTEKDGGKTAAASRIVSIPARLAAYLKNVPKTSLYFCAKVDGTPHTPSSFRRLWESYQYDLNRKFGNFDLYPDKPAKSKFDPKHRPLPFVIEGFTPHDLRHTCASLMYHAGVDALTASQQLGHSDPALTLKIYTHLDAQHKRKNMAKLDEYLACK